MIPKKDNTIEQKPVKVIAKPYKTNPTIFSLENMPFTGHAGDAEFMVCVFFGISTIVLLYTACRLIVSFI